MSNNIENKKYKWLEQVVRIIIQENPDRIAFCAALKDGQTLTAYHNCMAEDKANFAWHYLCDAMMDTVINNAEKVLKAAVADEDAGADDSGT